MSRVEGGPGRPVRSLKLVVSQLPAAPGQPKVQDLKVGMLTVETIR